MMVDLFLFYLNFDTDDIQELLLVLNSGTTPGSTQVEYPTCYIIFPALNVIFLIKKIIFGICFLINSLVTIQKTMLGILLPSRLEGRY